VQDVPVLPLPPLLLELVQVMLAAGVFTPAQVRLGNMG